MTEIPIGILGGTFDPVHCGHLRLALEVQRRLGLEAVRLVPLYRPAHRALPVATAAQRYRMLQLATESVPELIPDDCELQRQGTSYTIDTVRLLRNNYPDRPLCLIVGMDEFQQLNGWREWTQLPDYVHIIVVDRPGQEREFTSPEVADLYHNRVTRDMAALAGARAGRIMVIDTPSLEISATYIRQLIHTGCNIRYLLPDNVIVYIESERLYR